MTWSKYTVRCEYRCEIDCVKWMHEMYQDNQAIVSPVEKKNGTEHVHFIGYSEHDEKEFKRVREESAEVHPKKT